MTLLASSITLPDRNGDAMSTIEVDGFLCDEAEEFRPLILSKHKELFELHKDLNRFMMKLLSQQKIGESIDAKTIGLTLFCRIAESVQAVHVLLERGFISQAKVLTRAILESYFILGALQKKPELLQYYFDQHEEGRKMALKSACQFKGKLLIADAKKHGIENLYIQQKKALAGKQLHVLTPIGWATEADMEDFYKLHYVAYCNATHSNLSSLDDHWDGDESNISLAFGPSDRGLYDCLHCCIVVAANATSLTATVNDIDISADLDTFKAKLTLIESKHQEVEA